MDLRLRGLRAVVTGAGKGIGAAIAESLAAEGTNLGVVSRSQPQLEDLAKKWRAEHGVEVDVLAADLSTESGRQEVANAVDSLDILVNNAGAIPAGGLTDVSEETWRRAWDLKVYGYIFLTQSLYPKIAQSQHGAVLNIIGVAAEEFPAGYIAGSAGNVALVGFTKALAKKAWHDGVRVVGISPGSTATDRFVTLQRTRAATELGDAERWQELEASLPFGRACSPEEIADSATFLVSPRSSYTSGTVLTIDGGKV
ncbi:short-chain dehydrogenase/reductase [Kibdelosporangium philippinense]|uniref:Short-chain dehydrogenase/reductase n=1 Tax=Kibdelosporangium philippinense TaxID=211113 RepID=A0ABS8ZEY4_9PSEU|nr:short-chain dehydrogenase/reductase [Kibdelosporangium philippinense]MCE7006346.1 short-chain dehydrogenase/reductase [Kibdelosporangium philippinense]